MSGQQNLYGERAMSRNPSMLDLFMNALQARYTKAAIRQSQTISQLNEIKSRYLTKEGLYADEIMENWRNEKPRTATANSKVDTRAIVRNAYKAQEEAVPDAVAKAGENLYGPKDILRPGSFFNPHGTSATPTPGGRPVPVAPVSRTYYAF